MRLAIALALIASAGHAQQKKEDQHLKEAGVCARCHVISVVEWGMSAHQRAGTGCESCHGASSGHVIDERNNIKPERMPQGVSIAGLCADCHKTGCSRSGEKTGCQTCHHVHALIDPRKPAVAPIQTVAPRTAPAAAAKHARHYADAVRVSQIGIELVLVPGGEAEVGSDDLPRARPVHTVRVAPFYLARRPVTQAQWKAVMGSNPSARQGAKFPNADSLPVERVSWTDAQAFVRKLNEQVPGGGFRLPTEAEWEFAARAASKLGLLSLPGGVWEWCSSLDRPYPYDAADGREDLKAAGMRILRGAGEEDSPLWSGVAARHAERPDRRLRFNGLRVARDLP